MRIRKRFIISVILCLILVAAVVITFLREKNEKLHYNEKEGYVKEEQMDKDWITVDGIDYKRDVNVDAVLFLGIDKDAVADVDNMTGEKGQSDSINLIVCNEDTLDAQILQVSRDTMVDIELYHPDGEFYKKVPAQITLQYAFGDGRDFSCRLTTERVSELMYGVDITDYFALTLDGMAYVADVIGGIPIVVPEDYTDIDPAFKKGAEIVLDSELTERYVRYRDRSDTEGNNLRMARQAQFMEAFIVKIQNLEMDDNQLISLFQELKPYMVTNLTTDELKELSGYNYADEIYSLEGETKVVEERLQFHVDNEKLQEKVLELFYKQI